MKRATILAMVLAAIALLPVSASATSPAQKALEKPIRTLVAAVRYDKDALALKSLAGEGQGEVLLGKAWKKATPAQQKQFIADFQDLFAGLAFPKIRKAFKHLETIVYDPAKIDGKKASIASTLIVLHPLKKREYRVRYDLLKVGGAWKVLDVQVIGTGRPSMLAGIRDEQIAPLLEEGGVEGVLTTMTERLAQIRKTK